MAVWVGCLASSLLLWASSASLGLAAAAWHTVGRLPGFVGTGLLAAAGMGMVALAGWLWLEGQIQGLERAWLPDVRNR
jgi:hypothetical protein